MLNTDAVSPFLHIAYADEHPANRLAALHILTRLPLSDEAWRAVAGAASDCLHTIEASSGLNSASIEILAAVPVRSVRARLGEIARTAGHPASLACCLALARRKDAAGLQTLLGALIGSASEDISQHLACLPLEDLEVDRAPFKQLLQRNDPMMRFWAALALARLGDLEPLDQVFDAIMALEGGEVAAHPLFPEVPPLFWGDPWTPYAALAAARPLPAGMQALLVGLYQKAFARLKEREGPWARMPRNASILVGGLTGIVDVYGEPVEARPGKPTSPALTTADAARAEKVADRLLAQPLRDPATCQVDVDQDDLWSLAALSPERAGQVMKAVLSALEEVAQDRRQSWTPGDEIILNNALLDLVCALPTPIHLPLGQLIETYAQEGSALPSAALDWSLAQAGPETLAADLGPRIWATEGEARQRLLAWTESVAVELGAPAPFAGAGPSPSGAESGMGGVIDDYTAAAAPPSTTVTGVMKGYGYVSMGNLDLNSLPGGTTGLSPKMTAGAPGEATTGAEAPPRSRTAWPHLKCDDLVTVGMPFPLEVGIARQRDEKLQGTGEMTLPAQAFSLEIELMLDSKAFALVEGERCFKLSVSDMEPYPTRTMKLVALGGEELKPHRQIGVTYKADGILRGYASREVGIAGLTVPQPAPETQKKAGAAIDMSPFLDASEADLTIMIRHGDDAAGRTLLFSACSPLVDIPDQDEAPSVNIGATPDKFAESIVRDASSAADPYMLFDGLVGQGKLIAGKLPHIVHQALRDIATRAAKEERAATVLIISEDPYMPWELAVLEPPLPVPGCDSPFLGAQVALGRWVLSPDRPPPRPPRQVTVHAQAVVSGSYEGVLGWKRLPNAEEEAQTLLKNWPPSHGVSATYESVRQYLRGQEPADTLHFALHGKFDNSGLESGLVLIGHRQDRPDVAIPKFLSPSQVRSGDLSKHKPFVFLNACQVAAGQAVLGDYAGLASAFLFAGASAVVAPLWSIDDGQARDIAVAFYERAYKDKIPPAEILRSERARYCESVLSGADAVSGTHLAYQFFGHPLFMLTRAPSQGVNANA